MAIIEKAPFLSIILLISPQFHNYHISEYCELTICSETLTIPCERQKQYCKPDPFVCGHFAQSGLSESEEAEILMAHNKLRDNVAKGGETRGGLGKASDMDILSYSKELAFSAQCRCNSCVNDYDNCKATPKYEFGQNLYYSSKGVKKIAEAVEAWYSEIEEYKGGPNFEYSDDTRHFTQLIWSRSTLIGCGKTIYRGDKTLICCNYAAAGNVAGMQMYEHGEACSQCRDNRTCNEDFKGLCGKMEYLDQEFVSPFARKIKPCTPAVSLGNNLKPSNTLKLHILI